MTQPVLFIGHGNPMNALSGNPYTDDWRSFVQHLHRPHAIVCFSAHWVTRGGYVTGNDYPKTLHDFSGFPQSLSEMRYPCPGAPDLAAQISHRSAGNIDVSLDWGLDHGTWSVLVHLFPEANIPVLQISLDSRNTARDLFALGQSLQWLRDEGVLIIGSGNIAHNIKQWLRNPGGPFDWAKEFDQAVALAIRSNDVETLLNYQQLPGAELAVPTPEHLLPLFPVLGLRRPDDALTMTDYPPTSLENCSMRSLRFAPAPK